MKFYDREREKRLIKSFIKKRDRARILVVTGRRRIGKTKLVLESCGRNGIYLFTKKKSFNELISEWMDQIRDRMNFYGRFSNLEELLGFVFSESKKEPVALVIDEIQNLYSVSPQSFGEIQKVFDTKKEGTRVLLIFTGSVYSIMEKIFKDKKEPLFGRASEIIELSYLPISALEEILRDYNKLSGENLLHLYSITGGIPYYIEEIMENRGQSFKEDFKNLIVERDLLWEEGENLLKGEIGKEYGVYFSILSAISKGRRTRNEISEFTGIKELGGYLYTLEKTFRLIERRIPVLKEKNSRLSRYYISDNFLDFWFGFLDRYSFYREIEQKEKAFTRIWDELPVYEGRKLEELVLRKIIEERIIHFEFDRVGRFWDRKGELEVDLMFVNTKNREVIAFEIKRQRKKIKKERLKFLENIDKYIGELRGYKITPAVAFLSKNGLQVQINPSKVDN